MSNEETLIEDLKSGKVLFGKIPKEELTENICLEAVKLSGTNLSGVPKELQTVDICVAAGKDNGWVFRFKKGTYKLDYVREDLVPEVEKQLKAFYKNALVGDSIFGSQYITNIVFK